MPNPPGDLRLGMYADVAVTGVTGASALAIPRSAVQNVGDRTVAYLANPKEQGKFTEREVRLGQTSGEQQIQVVSGVPPGDVLVNDGSFYLRAERERLGPRPAPAAVGATAPDRSVESGSAGDVRSAKIVVNERGFEPAQVTLRAGALARLTFIRTTGSVRLNLKVKSQWPSSVVFLTGYVRRRDGVQSCDSAGRVSCVSLLGLIRSRCSAR